jgi:poly(beta-D-mannuronate) lyase
MKRFFVAASLIGSLLSLAHAATIRVKNEIELQNANRIAVAGDIIILQNGKWNNINLQLTCNGTAQQPILFKAATSGSVHITGKSSLKVGGNWIIVEGLAFTEGYTTTGNVWEFKSGNQVANNSRITNCLISSFNNPDRMKENYWVALYGKNNRIDHNSFINKTNMGVLMAVILEDDRSRMNSHSIDSNYFGIRKPLGSNSGEIIRIGVSEHCTFYSNTKILNNLFDQCDGETEIISVKSCGNLVRNNVFKECQGAVVLRHGNNNTIESNLFLGNGKKGSGGVRVINEGNWIVNNYFSHCAGEGFRSPLAIMNGVFNSPPNRYLPVRDAVIANNTFSNCTPFSLCEGSDAERSVSPKNVYLINNLFYSDKPVPAFEYYDRIDSIYFSGNIINSKISKPLQAGFSQKDPAVSMVFDNAFPVYTTGRSKVALPDSIMQQASKRLQYGLKEMIGCTSPAYFTALYKQSGKLGIQWKILPEKQNNQVILSVECIDANAVYGALKSTAKSVKIILTGTSYVFDHPLVISKNTSFSTSQSEINFSSSVLLPSLFELKANTVFELNKIKINSKGLNAGNFIAADSTGTCIHFTVKISNSSFSGLNNSSFLNTYRSAYADLIAITNTRFINNSSYLFKLTDEREKKGYYNVEQMLIDHCVFDNNNGELLGLYRAGVDESTMGPDLVFTNNKISNCNSNESLIHLLGVQRSVLINNSFNNSNNNRITIKYTDNLRAKHEQKNNSFVNSGSVIENKFVTNLK